MKSNLKKWVKAMEIGSLLRCHQMPERSFFWRGYQFPVCSRCLGVLIGHFLAIITLPFYHFPIILALLFCTITLVDWLLQYMNILESSNLRRVITGILGGIGVIVLPIRILEILYAWFKL